MVHQEPAPITPELLGQPGMRFTLITDPRFTVYGELKGGNLFLHCSPITQWNRETYLACLEAVSAINVQATANGLTMLYAFLPLRQVKFATMMGFVPETVYAEGLDEPFVLCTQKAGIV